MTARHQDAPAPAPEPGPRGAGQAASAKRPRPAPAPVPGSMADRSGAVPEAAADGARPDDATVMGWLAQVPDPEIPAVSLVDLGGIRGLAWDGDVLEVTVAPTYSGCPATAVIELSVEDALCRRGLTPRVRRSIAPPWTTDWITPEGRAKMAAYGIAPPDPRGPQACPHCGAGDLERVSQFGSTPCKAQWRCRSCAEPFDYFKCH